MRCILIFLIVALGVAASIGWRRAALAREENGRLRAEIETLKQESAALSEEQARQQQLNSNKAATDAQELVKLRGDVSRLRGTATEAEKLRGEVATLKGQVSETARQKSQAETVAAATPATDQFPRQSWAFSGYGTPEAALVSAIWAMKEGKPQVFMDSLSPEEQQRMAQSWQGKSAEEIAAKHQNDVGNIQGMRILSRTPISPTEVQMQVFLEGVNRMETFKMNQAADQQWKFSGFIRK